MRPLSRLVAPLMCVVLAGGSVGCGGSHRPPAVPAAASDNVRSDDAVHVQLHARDDEQWSLRRADGAFVCALPCSYWVKPDSGLSIHLDRTITGAMSGIKGESAEDISYDLPAHLPANAGEEITVTVDRTHGLGIVGKVIAAPLVVVFGLMGLAFTTLSIVSLATGSKNTKSTASACASTGGTSTGGTSTPSASTCFTKTDTGVASDVGALAVGIGALTIAALSMYWFVHDHEGGLDFERAPARREALRVRVGPGVVSVETPAARAWLTPAGITGTF